MSRVIAASRGSSAAPYRARLFASSAAVALLTLSASPVLAQSVGVPTGGQASEPATSVEPLDEPTVIEVDDAFTYFDGEHAVVGEAAGDLEVRAGTVNTLGHYAHGIATSTADGRNSITAGSVGTYGDASLAIVAQSLGGDISITVDDVRTAGAVSDAVSAFTETGDIDVSIGRVRTEGQDAWGLYAVSTFGAVRADVGQVETLRDGGIGLVVAGGSGASVTVDSILTSGFGATGVHIVAGDFYNPDVTGDAVLKVRSIETRGAEAAGVSVVAIGKADVMVGSVRTHGEFADGVTTYSRFGESRVAVDSVHVSGYGSSGVFSGVEDANLALTVKTVVTDGDSSAAIRARARRGNLALTAGDLTTQGVGSHGIVATVVGGDAQVVTQGVVQTRGAAANGIMTATSGRTSITAADVRTSGDYANGIDVFAAWADYEAPNSRSVDIVAASVTTEGANAHGIRVAMPVGGIVIGEAPSDRPAPNAAPAADGPDDTVTIRAGSVTVKGEGSVGVWAQGLGGVTVEADHVASQLGEAIRIDARADASLKLNGNVSGGGASAVNVTGEDITLNVAKSAVITGAQDAIVLAAQGPYVPPPPEEWGRAPASSGVATLDNAGVIRAGAGAAIRVTSGTAVISNAGRIEGSLILGDGDDQVTNTGTLVMTANNDFGTGADLFTNKGGTVQFGKAAAPLNLSFLGLERFANEGGLVDLRNERAGDSLTLSGAYAASGSALLALDVGPGVVDRLIVQGAATGRTAIILQGKAEDATLLDKSLSLVTVGQGSTAGAFALADSDIGLIRYGLTYDGKTSSYMLNASAGRAVEQTVRAGEGLTASWRASADAFNAEQAMARAAGGDRGRVWAQAHGSFTDRDGGDAGSGLGYEQDLVGGQMGVSLGAQSLWGGQVGFGLTGGYVDSTLSFEADAQTVDVQTLNGGVYGAWRRENLFATGLVKIDSHTLEIEDRAAGFETEIDALSWGGQVSAGYRFDLGGIALEPTIGLDYLSTTIDDLDVLKQTVTFDDHQGFSARAGATALARSQFADGRAVVWSAGLEAVHAFDADYAGALHSKGLTDTVTLEGPATYGRAQAGVQFEVGGGLETYVQGEARFGEGESGGGVRIGARYRF